MLCSKCQKNMAVVFITKLEGDNQTNEGLCLKCAKAMGIAPLDQFMDQMGKHEIKKTEPKKSKNAVDSVPSDDTVD